MLPSNAPAPPVGRAFGGDEDGCAAAEEDAESSRAGEGAFNTWLNITIDPPSRYLGVTSQLDITDGEVRYNPTQGLTVKAKRGKTTGEEATVPERGEEEGQMATFIWEAQKNTNIGGPRSAAGRSYPSHTITSPLRQLNLLAKSPTHTLAGATEVVGAHGRSSARPDGDKWDQQTGNQGPGWLGDSQTRLGDSQMFLVSSGPGPPSPYTSETP